MNSSTKKVSALALAGAFAAVAGMGIASGTAHAADEFEKCYGISKAAGNDCASEGNNTCAGTCRRLSGGGSWTVPRVQLHKPRDLPRGQYRPELVLALNPNTIRTLSAPARISAGLKSTPRISWARAGRRTIICQPSVSIMRCRCTVSGCRSAPAGHWTEGTSCG